MTSSFSVLARHKNETLDVSTSKQHSKDFSRYGTYAISQLY